MRIAALKQSDWESAQPIKTRLRILHLEDEPDFCQLVEDILARDGLAPEVLVVADFAALTTALEARHFDIILADFNLPTCTGLEALQEASRRCPRTPFVLVSGTLGEEAAIDLLNRGATDYVLKQRLERLAPVVRRAVQEAGKRNELARAQRELAEQQNYIEALTENALDVITTLTPEGVVRYTSPSVKTVLGYEPEDLVGQKVFSLVHPDDLVNAKEAFERALKNPELRIRHELRFRRQDGSWCHLEVVGQSHLGNSRINAVVLNSRDITERKQAEARLRLQSSALESAANALVITNREGAIVWANAAFSRLTGYAIEEVLGKNPRLLSSNKHDKFFYKQLWDTVLSGRVWHSEMINRHKDGHLYTEETTITPVRDEQGQIGHFIAVKQDISERKRAQLELAETHNQLVGLSRQAAVAEFATGVLHNVGNVLNSVGVASSCLAQSLQKSNSARLAQVVDLLRAHQGDLGGFFTNDPKGKLIPGYLSQLAERLAAEQAAALREIAGLQSSIEHIKAIISVQQDSAKGSSLPEKVQITELVEEALRMTSKALARAKVEVIKEFVATPPVTVPKHGVLQILVNLARNAVQAFEASSSECKRLTIGADHSRDRFRVFVADNGPGISAENLPKIFNLGFTTKKDGHGFGLHSAKIAATEMGGTLTVQSDGLGRGATFTLDLPTEPLPVLPKLKR